MRNTSPSSPRLPSLIQTGQDRERSRDWNAGARRLFGSPEGEVHGRHLTLFFTPEDRGRGEPQAEWRTAAALGRASDDGSHVCKDGTRLRGNGVTAALRDQAGAPRANTKVSRDRIGQKGAEDAVRASEERLRGCF